MVLLTEANGTPTTCQKLSAAGCIPEQYASKVLSQLRRAGMAKGQRGRYGGFVIGCDPNEVTLLDIVNVIDPLQRITGCPMGREAHATRLCPLHSQIDHSVAALEAGLSQMTIKELVEQGSRPPLCTEQCTQSVSVSLTSA